ncbi:MAG TPA: hypothetical protein DIT05_04545 [Morganella sp. (in: Bacteria)]|nr:hypothetical protein [Morganella sp. (in: enterobacteria)]
MSNVMDNYAEQPRPLTVVIDNRSPCVASRLHAHESLTDGSRLEVSLLSATPLTPALLGRLVVVSYRDHDIIRTFAGLAEQLECEGFHPDKQHYFYRITATDPITFLRHGQQRRLFQNQNSKAQITTLLTAHQLSAFVRFALRHEGEATPCMCQMDESDSAMIRRIMAAQGWFCFRNPDNITQWTITDSLQHAALAACRDIPWRVAQTDDDVRITQFRACWQATGQHFSAQTYSQEQHHSRTETQSLAAAGTTQQVHYYDTSADSAQIACDAAAVCAHYYEAGSAISSLSAGMRFRFCDHPVDDYNDEYYISEITHIAESSESGGNPLYNNTFRCHQTHTPFRVPLVGKPRNHALQTATVVGPDNSETWYDAQGRVKVRFHWEDNSGDGSLSQAWLPVIAPGAGAGAGVQFLPRVGDAVVIQFLNGDPDKPVVAGALWYRDHPRPFSDAATSGIYSRSTPDGTRGAGNQLRFEDKRDEECLALAAQRDLQLTANNDWLTQIKGAIRCETDKSLTVASKDNMQYQSEKQWQLNAREGITQQTEKNLKMQADNTLTADAKTIRLTAAQTLTLAVGSSKIELSAGGIALSAPQITVKGDGKVTLESAVLTMSAQAKAQLTGALVQIDASAMAEVKGGAVVKINGALTTIN